MSKENKATSHTPLIDHHYKTYHHRQFQIHHHLAFCCPVGRMIVNTWVPLQSRNSTKNITADHNFSQIITIISLLGPSLNKKKRVMEKIVMEAKEGEKKRGTKGKIEQMKIMLYEVRQQILTKNTRKQKISTVLRCTNLSCQYL
ncbi:hypothetical protein ACJX0J_021964, partial [Zea mays]